MRMFTGFGLAAALLAGATAVGAEKLESGLKVGDSVGAFDVVKATVAPDDGVAEGQKLCYR